MAGEIDFSVYRDYIADACQSIVNVPVFKYAPQGVGRAPFWLIDVRRTERTRVNYRTYVYQITAECFLVRDMLQKNNMPTIMQALDEDMEAAMAYWEDKTDFTTANNTSNPSGFTGQVELVDVTRLQQPAGSAGNWIGTLHRLTWQHRVSKGATME